MAMTLRPADGLVTRLLQQQTRSHPVAEQNTSAKEPITDQVQISNQARQQQSQSGSSKQQDLESQLLRLYAHHNKADTKL